MQLPGSHRKYPRKIVLGNGTIVEYSIENGGEVHKILEKQ